MVCAKALMRAGARAALLFACAAAASCTPQAAVRAPGKPPAIPASFRYADFAPPDLGIPYSYAGVEEIPGGYIVRGVRVPHPQAFGPGSALTIDAAEIRFSAEQPEAPGILLIESLTLRSPRIVFDWSRHGSNLDILLHTIAERRRAGYRDAAPRWRIEKLVIDGGSINALDEWLGRERIDIPMEYGEQALLHGGEGWSTAGLIERCGAALMLGLHATLDEFDGEMRELDEAVSLQLKEYFDR